MKKIEIQLIERIRKAQAVQVVRGRDLYGGVNALDFHGLSLIFEFHDS